jgi:DNA gyrase/topoisomerase IV subunit B
MSRWAKIRNRKIAGRIAYGGKKDWYFLGRRFEHLLAIEDGGAFFLFELPLSPYRVSKFRRKQKMNLAEEMSWEITRIEEPPMTFDQFHEKAAKTGTYKGLGDFDIDARFATTMFPGEYRLSAEHTGKSPRFSTYYLEKTK